MASGQERRIEIIKLQAASPRFASNLTRNILLQDQSACNDAMYYRNYGCWLTVSWWSACMPRRGHSSPQETEKITDKQQQLSNFLSSLPCILLRFEQADSSRSSLFGKEAISPASHCSPALSHKEQHFRASYLYTLLSLHPPANCKIRPCKGWPRTL